MTDKEKLKLAEDALQEVKDTVQLREEEQEVFTSMIIVLSILRNNIPKTKED